MPGLFLFLLLLELGSMSSFITAISFPHFEQNFAASSILKPHEAQNSYIPPIILLHLLYDMLLHFWYATKIVCHTGTKPNIHAHILRNCINFFVSLCKIQFRIVSYTGTQKMKRSLSRLGRRSFRNELCATQGQARRAILRKPPQNGNLINFQNRLLHRDILWSYLISSRANLLPN